MHDLAARLVIPLLDLRPGAGDAAGLERAHALRDCGVGGFILFGGERDALPRQLSALRAGAPDGRRLLVGADLERGAGQQVQGAGLLPPALALGAADDAALARRTGEALGRDALALGIDWVLGPVLDLADEPRNPIVGARALGADPQAVARLGVAFLEGVQAGGALACAKHFPGHGGTTGDSHAELPTVARSAEALRARDLLPFAAAVRAGVASVMTAHVAYPALSLDSFAGSTRSAAGLPATVDPALIDGLLRRELGFQGLVVTDALIMEGVRAEGEPAAAVRALEAGCDLILYPQEPEAVIDALAAWGQRAPENAARLRASAARLDAAIARVGAAPPEADACAAAGAEVARAALAWSGAAALAWAGPPPAALRAGEEVALLVLNDDPDVAPGLGHELSAALLAAGVVLRPVTLEAPVAGAALAEASAQRLRDALAADGRVLAVVGCRVRAWKGRPDLHPALADALRGLPAERTTVLALCGPWPLRGALPPGAPTLWAWGDEPCCQVAAAAALLGAPAPGSLPPGFAPNPGGP